VNSAPLCRIGQGVERAELPKLRVGIYQDGRLVRWEELPDPRNEFIRQYNEDAGEQGFRAVA
jgi:hypothetical protein